MKRQRIIPAVFVLMVFLLGGCTEQPETRSYTNTQYGFSFNPPSGWQQTNSKSSDVVVSFSPKNSSDVSLVVGVPFILGEGRALSTLADEVEQNLSESGMNFTILSRDWLSIPNVNAYELVYSYEQDGRMEYVKQVAVMKTRTVFLLTFTAPLTASTRYLSDVDQSIETFLL